ncbi:MAG: NAD(P)/FAD-dependent oxidoreductase [Mangrovicoccus sp.]|nr:NAD(P)/FAD-dependent oxidoreductase [Mangrovicoccus sp.]
MDLFEADCVVIGAGVIGLAIARALALAGRQVLILEKNAGFGEETSARNSEVIHAGIYYPPGSFKARHCVAGRQKLYEFCAGRAVPHHHCGKLIVACSPDETAKLPQIAKRAAENGVEDLRLLSAAQAQALEPALQVQGALHVPATGIVDSHALMLALLGEAQAHGAELVLRAQVTSGRLTDHGGMDLEIAGQSAMRLRARCVINAAGLWAAGLSQRLDGLPPPPNMALVKGNYFTLARKAPFSRLIYPVPQDGGLGVHLTLDLAGQARFGPDTEWLGHSDPAQIDYQVDAARREGFAQAIQSYWPDLNADDLAPAYSGVRPKLAGAAYPDFRIDGPTQLPGPHVMLYGMESPGLTSALSVADHVAQLLA